MPGGLATQMCKNPLKPISNAWSLVTMLMLASAFSYYDPPVALAQVTTAVTPTAGAGDLGTIVTPNGNVYGITEGKPVGNNLFHSFAQFSVGTGDVAQFQTTTLLPNTAIHNILGRVTGQNSSSIFGTIDSACYYPDANLFLMNPNGIVFGPGAALNVGGSVAFTTADYFRLAAADGSNAGIFHAETASTSLLTSASVAAFGFLGTNQAAVAVQGSTLTVKPGQSISLVGGNQRFASVPNGVTVTGGKLSAPGGQVNIASVASRGEVMAGTLEYAPNIKGESFGEFGTIQISQQSNIDTSGVGDGTIHIRGGRLIVDASMISASTGDISLDAISIRITDAAQIVTGTVTAANAGHIILKASGNIDVDSSLVGSTSEHSLGNAGNITFNSSQGNVNFVDNTFITSQTVDSSGNAGNIALIAPHGNIVLDMSQVLNATRGTGTLGGIEIIANNLQLLDESRIDGDNFVNQIAGNISIMLENRLSLTGQSAIQTATSGSVAAANLIIKAPEILIGEKSSLSTGTTGSGAGGAIDLSARSLTIQNGGTISAETSGTAPSATGGSIIINTTDHVTMTSGASITASSTDPGNADAGNILIKAGQQFDMRDSSVTAEAKQASGGNIDIQAVDRIRVVNSTISSSVQGGASTAGGNITIDPNLVVLQNSQVIAQAVQGAGGNITITTPLFIADSDSLVSASSQLGVNGTVTIQSPTSNLSGSLGTLPSEPSQAHSLLTQRCAALVNGQTSSFVVAGRQQLPADPGGWLTSPLAFAALGGSLDAGHTIASTPAVMAMATDDTGTVSLRRLTPAGFLMANFADSEATGCRS